MTGLAVDDVVDRLTELVHANALPARARPTAEQLLHRLTSPVQVAIAGDDMAGGAALHRLVTAVQSETGFAPNIAFVTAQTGSAADMLIWVVCDGSDAMLDGWHAQRPDAAQHAFLVLNTPDGDRALSSKTRAALLRRGFAASFGLDILREAASFASLDGADDMPASELDRFFSALQSYVNAGCQADMDGALLFLQRFSNIHPTALETPSEAPLEALAPRPLEPPVESAPAPPMDTPAPQIPAVCHALMEHMRPLQSMALTADDAGARVLQHHLDALDALTETEDLPGSLDAPLRQTQDVILLLQLEDTETSAAEATLAMLQLKRHLLSAQAA